jgi:hypothetical protein
VSRHTELIDAVNDAKTLVAHNDAESRLGYWRERNFWSGIEADVHTMNRFGDRPMCCGVLLDWMPQATGSAA